MVRLTISLLSISLVFFSSLVIPAAAEGPVDGASLLETFSASTNSVERRTILSSLNDITLQYGEKAPQWVSDLLGIAIKDKSPVVVAVAAKQIGQFNLLEHNAEMVALYTNADKLFGASGYTHRIQYAAITSLGKLGSKEAKALVSELLKNDNGSAMGEYLLTAVKDFNDPAFINNLRTYKQKMDSYVKAAKANGDNPILYSRKLGYSECAAEIEKTLAAKGGK
ncbi:MAG: HEAT repeat domain-containing protein [Chitinispirillaceae bacterium]|nr:HEAT repeat domain-containing protein [Chitinispirillaceae bacterium]